MHLQLQTVATIFKKILKKFNTVCNGLISSNCKGLFQELGGYFTRKKKFFNEEFIGYAIYGNICM